MVVEKEALLKRISDYIGEDNSDESISLLEDISDTYDSLGKEDSEDWKAKYEENDAMWREKYRSRFTSGNTDKTIEDTTQKVEETTVEETVESYDDLFKEE